MANNQKGWEEPNLPTWATLLIMLGLLTLVAFLSYRGGEEVKKRKDIQEIETYSRMSDSKEVQEAYERIYPLKY